MEPEFITYKKFDDLALAKDLSALLDQNKVTYKTEEQALTFDPTFASVRTQIEYAIKIKSEDFEKVNKLLEERDKADVEKIDKDYYLFAFSNDELKEVLNKADEWSSFDVVLARKLLTERGLTLSDEDLATIKNERLEELREPDGSQTPWIIVGYIIALSGIILPFFITVIGLFIGWHLSSHKKTLPDGEKVYTYNEVDRKHGKRIFYLGIVVFVLSFGYFIYKIAAVKY